MACHVSDLRRQASSRQCRPGLGSSAGNPEPKAQHVRARHGAEGSWGGFEDEQRRVAVRSMWDGEVAAVGGGVDGDDVGAVGEVAAAGHGGVPVVYVEGGQPSAFGGGVDLGGGRIVSKHAEVLPEGVVFEDL